MTDPPEAGRDGEDRAAKRARPKGSRRTSGAPYRPTERHTLGQNRGLPAVPTAPDPGDHVTDHDDDQEREDEDDDDEGDNDA